MGNPGDKTGYKKGKRGDQHNHHGNDRTDGQHENKRTQNGYHTGKKLRKPLQKPVGNLIDVVDNTADDIPVRVAVDIFQRQTVDFLVSLFTQVAHRIIGNLISTVRHDPLKHRTDSNCSRQHGKDGNHLRVAHITGADNLIYRPADQNRAVQSQGNMDEGADQRAGHITRVGLCVAKQAF